MTAYWLDRDAVRVAGPEAESFLQGQLSQDVAALGEGEAAWSLLLQPQGKIDAFLRVTRIAGDAFVLDTDGGWGERVVERLQRFKLRVKAEIEMLDWRCLAVRAGDGGTIPPVSGGGAMSIPFVWGPLAGFDLLGPEPEVPAGAELGDPGGYDRRRIEAGVPVMGKELDDRTIPAEAGLVERAVNFTKGCYTGQELVARIDSRGGNVPRRLRLVRVAGAVPAPGSPLTAPDGKEVGTLTSVAATPEGAVALAYVGRGVAVPAELTLQGAAAAVTAIDR